MSMRHFLNFSKLRKIGHLTFEKKNTLFWSEPQSFVSKLWGSLQILLQTALCFFVQSKVSIRLFTKNHKTGTSNEGNIFSVLQSFSLSRGSPEATIISPPTISNSAMSASLMAVLETFIFVKIKKCLSGALCDDLRNAWNQFADLFVGHGSIADAQTDGSVG